MSVRSMKFWVVAALVAVTSSVSAQEGRGLSDKDKADAATATVAALKDVLAQVKRKVEDARRDRDVMRLTCVLDREKKIDELLKVADLSLEELKAAVKDKQSEAVDHEFNKIAITKQKIEQYKQESDQCIGLLAFYDNEKMQVVVSDSNKDSAEMDVLSTDARPTSSVRPAPASPNR